MAQLGEAHPVALLLPHDDEGVGVVAKFFRALGDPTRLRLLEYLLHEEHTVGECVEHVGLAQSRVSTHLACLADCGYLTARRSGRRTFYRVTDPRVGELVSLTRALAADNAAAVADCVRIAPQPGL
ncbi:ArsR/SmtB family transcription factor [Phytohabitans aurantiacus]|uniref:Mercury resistance operon repressor MerR n=1 Tax=Phytohabitans aurantiacus TaxID=3016789 RepID=A0ABQ5R2M9_9ACTN|nr:metalloregulator ArsR/SmtB family transcription factor [Phytohabitans aurantiacus]GLI01029.1 mercury resistance operon repressor MerR [Phytohabitans aurantiacus]